MDKLREEQSHLIEQCRLVAGSVSQGVALADTTYFGSTSGLICRFDTSWNLVEERDITVEGVNHIGAIDYHEGYVWAGLLNHARVDGEHDPSQNRSVIAKIYADNLEVVSTWDVTGDGLTWIDPVCFDGEHLWVGEMNNLGIHRFAFVDGELTHCGVLRYPREMSFSQGVRVAGESLYTIHTFGEMDGLFEFHIPDTLTEAVNQPVRVWHIQETMSHLEGFAFIPDHPNQVWHAQGSQVDRYELAG